MIFGFLSGLALLLSINSYAQNITANKIIYHYYRKPVAASFFKTIRNYQVVVEDNATMPVEMADVNHKAIGALIPARRDIVQPANGPEPINIDDANEMADTRISLKGYKHSDVNPLKVVITLYGFEHTWPHIVTEQHTSMSLNGGQSYTYESIHYHTEFTYRYKVGVTVFTPDGKKVAGLVQPLLADYKKYEGYPKIRIDEMDDGMVLEEARDKALSDDLKLINKQLNYAMASIKRAGTLYQIEDKQNTDLDEAYSEASSGLLLLQQDYWAAKTKLKEADSLWTAALRKSNVSTDMAKALCFNLLEVNFASGNLDRAQLALKKLDSYDLSDKERKERNDLDVLITDRKIHQQAVHQL